MAVDGSAALVWNGAGRGLGVPDDTAAADRLSYCDVPHGHAHVAVAEQLLESEQADTEADHLGSEGMATMLHEA